MNVNIQFCISKCPVDFNVYPYLRIPCAEILAKSQESSEALKNELSYAVVVLTNQIKRGYEERGEQDKVVILQQFSEKSDDIFSNCKNFDSSSNVYIGYQRYEKDNKDYLIPQIQIA